MIRLYWRLFAPWLVVHELLHIATAMILMRDGSHLKFDAIAHDACRFEAWVTIPTGIKRWTVITIAIAPLMVNIGGMLAAITCWQGEWYYVLTPYCIVGSILCGISKADIDVIVSCVRDSSGCPTGHVRSTKQREATHSPTPTGDTPYNKTEDNENR